MKKELLAYAAIASLVIMGAGCCNASCDKDDPSLIEKKVMEGVREIKQAQEKLKVKSSLKNYEKYVEKINGTNVWASALQKALDENEIVVIPSCEEKYYIEKTVVIPSNRRIEAHGATVRLIDGMNNVMFTTKNAMDGTLKPIPQNTRGENVAIIGGRWEDNSTRRRGYGRSGMFNNLPRKTGNYYGVSTLFYLGNTDKVTVRDVTFYHTGGFSIQSGDSDATWFENIYFDRCFADGLHLNGNMTRIYVKNVRGNVGDDLVALNAYDWINSSINFGPQKYILCEDLELIKTPGASYYPAIRIQPAIFRYADMSEVDCAISDLIFRRVKGIVTYKMYLQTPRYKIGGTREWSKVGSGGNLHFEDLTIESVEPIDKFENYMKGDPLRGHFAPFEFGANLSSVYFKNINLTFDVKRFPTSHIAVVGPKSSIAVNKKDNITYEIFDPWVSCKVGKVVLENIKINGEAPKELVHAVEFNDINKDGNSTGKGVIKEIVYR
jgi:hypothetical protein